MGVITVKNDDGTYEVKAASGPPRSQSVVTVFQEPNCMPLFVPILLLFLQFWRRLAWVCFGMSK